MLIQVLVPPKLNSVIITKTQVQCSSAVFDRQKRPSHLGKVHHLFVCVSDRSPLSSSTVSSCPFSVQSNSDPATRTAAMPSEVTVETAAPCKTNPVIPQYNKLPGLIGANLETVRCHGASTVEIRTANLLLHIQYLNSIAKRTGE